MLRDAGPLSDREAIVFAPLTTFAVWRQWRAEPPPAAERPALTLFAAPWGCRRGLRQPVLALFLGGSAFSVLLFAIWAAIWHGQLPQFSQ